MSGETEKEVSAWTIDSLRYHLEQIAADLDRRYEQRFEAQEKAVQNALIARDKEVDAAFRAQETAMQTALTAAEKAVDKALASQKEAVNKSEASYDKRFEAVNEFRAQLADQARQFLPRAEYAATNSAVVDKVSDLTDRLNRTEGKSTGTTAALAGLLAVATVAISIIVVVVNVLVK